MTTTEWDSRIKKLSRRENQVIRLRCEFLPGKEIEQRLRLKKGTVNQYLTRAYSKLGIYELDQLRRLKVLSEHVGPIILRDDPPEGPDDAEEPDDSADSYQLSRIDLEEKLIYEHGPSGVQALTQALPTQRLDNKNRRPSRVLWFVLGAFLAGLAIFATLSMNLVPPTLLGIEVPSPVVQVKQETVVVNATTDPSQLVAAPLVQTAVVKETVLVPQTVVVEQTVIVTQTVVVEPTPEPIAATGTPTTEPTPAANVLFQDDFDTGISTAWNIQGSSVAMVDQELAANGVFGGVVGDNSWTNYVVEFNLIGMANSSFNSGLEVQVRRQDDANFMTAQIKRVYDNGVCTIRWTKTVNGEESMIVNSEREINRSVCPGILRIEVNGNNYKLSAANEAVLLFVDDTFKTGGVGLLSTSRHIKLRLDDFKVISLE